MKLLLLFVITLVEGEFALHVIYHAITGKAGLYDPAFDYLKDIWKYMKKRFIKKKKNAEKEMKHER